MRRTLVALLALCALSACDSTDSLKTLRAAQPSADPYHMALAEEYRAFAEEKLAAYDWWTSKYFADKGLLATYERQVEPEQPNHWNLINAEFLEARERLLRTMETHRASQPQLLAALVVDYDRWVELAHNGWDAPRIEAARDMFYATLDELETPVLTGSEHGLSSAPAAPQATAAIPKQPEPLIPSVVETTSAVLYFPFDADALTGSARAALDEMLQYIRSAGKITVSINGHADRVGEDDYNLTLSQRRARFVVQQLEQAGVPREQIEYFAFGESDPKVPTADNIAEPHNRRVEIFLE